MRSPVVSRESFEDMKAQRDDFKHRYDTLLAQYHALRLEGANLPYPKAEPRAPDPVSQAIVHRSFGSKLLRQQYASLVTARRIQGISEDEIAAEILRGVSASDGFTLPEEEPEVAEQQDAHLGSVAVV